LPPSRDSKDPELTADGPLLANDATSDAGPEAGFALCRGDVFLDLDPERRRYAGDGWWAALNRPVARCELFPSSRHAGQKGGRR
jgi:hypothetical protein